MRPRSAPRTGAKPRPPPADNLGTVRRPRLRIRPALVKKGFHLALKFAQRAVLSGVLLVFLGLCLLGFLVGRDEVPRPAPAPVDDLFDQIQVYSYRESPSDTNYRFVAELSAFGKTFAEYDIDKGQFVTSGFGRRYDRAFSGAHYAKLELRGHAGEGCWLTVPDTANGAMTQGQFDELTRRTLDYVKPVGFVTNFLGMLSGYSIGYRLGTWEASLANPAIQKKLLATPGIASRIKHEAWRRVLLEPAFMSSQPDAGTFANVLEQQRVYNRFYLLALEDTSGFIAQEAARLDAAGQPEYAHAMTGFARAVRRARDDSSSFGSTDFRAVEVWAGMLFSRGHWARFVTDSTADARFRYLGALAHYNLNPPEAPSSGGRHDRQVWVGPRALVTIDHEEGYIADEIPTSRPGCPTSWKSWLMPGVDDHVRNQFTVRWVKPPGHEFLQVANALRRMGERMSALAQAGRTATPAAQSAASAPQRLHLAPRPVSSVPVIAEPETTRRDSVQLMMPDSLLSRGIVDTMAMPRDSASADSLR